MSDQNGSQEHSTAPDYNQAMIQARETGDFDFVLKTAKDSKKMLEDFRDAILRSRFEGRDSTALAMGLNFITSMVQNATQQLAALKQTAKATQDAIKAGGANPPSEVA